MVFGISDTYSCYSILVVVLLLLRIVFLFSFAPAFFFCYRLNFVSIHSLKFCLHRFYLYAITIRPPKSSNNTIKSSKFIFYSRICQRKNCVGSLHFLERWIQFHLVCYFTVDVCVCSFSKNIHLILQSSNRFANVLVCVSWSVVTFRICC